MVRWKDAYFCRDAEIPIGKAPHHITRYVGRIPAPFA
jgi:hypothetical protein